MPIRVLTVSYCRERGRFVDDELRALTDGSPVTSSHHHVVEADGAPRLVFVLEFSGAHADVSSSDRGTAAFRASPTNADTSAAALPPTMPIARTPTGRLDLSQLTPSEQQTFEVLRRWRSEQAHGQGVPPFVVLTNRHLLELIAKRPNSVTALGRIHGIGKAKVERYGAALLEILARLDSRDPAVTAHTAQSTDHATPDSSAEPLDRKAGVPPHAGMAMVDSTSVDSTSVSDVEAVPGRPPEYEGARS